MPAQSLERGLTLLKLLSSAGRDGARLVDIHAKTGLSKPTIHRMLDTLKFHGFAEQVPETRRYRLGNEIPLLGWSVAQELTQLTEVCGESLSRLARRTGDTAFLFFRSGLETICLDRKAGTYPVKAFTVDVGVRRPLGVGASGIAFLAEMSDAEVSVILKEITASLARWPIDVDQVTEAVKTARMKGYAFSEGFTVPDVRGIAKVVHGQYGDAIATLGIAAISNRFGGERLPDIKMHLDECVEMAETTLREMGVTSAFPR